jgi:hypothetical protein
MADNKHTEVDLIEKLKTKKIKFWFYLKDTILLYIDEQICSRLIGSGKKNCKEMIDTNGRELLNNIKNGIVRKKEK